MTKRIKITTVGGGCIDFEVGDEFVFEAFTLMVRDRGFFEYLGPNGGIHVPYSAITVITMETEGKKMEGFRFPEGMSRQ